MQYCSDGCKGHNRYKLNTCTMYYQKISKCPYYNVNNIKCSMSITDYNELGACSICKYQMCFYHRFTHTHGIIADKKNE